MSSEAQPLSQELKRMLELAWPVVLSQLGLIAMGVTDVLMVGQLGKAALASTLLAHSWSFSGLILVIGGSFGLDPWMAQAIGAADARRADLALLRGLVVLGLLALPITVQHLLAGPGLTLLQQPASAIPDATAFSTVLALGVLPMVPFVALRQHLQARGRMREALIAVLFANLVNIAVNATFIHGYLGMPALGALGCAWATVLSRCTMVVILAVLGRDALPVLSRTLVNDVFHWPALRALLTDVLPVSMQTALEVWAFNTATFLVGTFGEAAVAGHGIVLNLTAVSFMVPTGLGAAASTRVGNLVGAGLPIIRAAQAALGTALLFMGCASLTLFLAGGMLTRLFSPDADVREIAATLVLIGAGFQLFDGIQAVAFGVLRGAGDTRWPSLANLLGYWVIGLPFGAWLAHRYALGAAGVWLGLTLALATVASLLLWRVSVVVPRGGSKRLA